MITSINNGNNVNLGRHCGKKTRQTTLVTGDYAVLTFHADDNQERKGFLLSFSAIQEGKLNQKQQTDSSGAKILPRGVSKEVAVPLRCSVSKGLQREFS